MKYRSPLLAALVAWALAGCQVAAPPVGKAAADQVEITSRAIRGRVTFEADPAVRYRLQATVGEVANAATVSLIDAKTGNTVASSVSDARGAFTLTFRDFVPVSGAPYTLEAVKGLSLGGKPNRPGATAVRVRTLLYWNGGWQSLTNTTAGVGITISPATTAVATAISLKKSAGQNLDLATLIGKVSGSSFDESGTGLSRAADFAPVLALVQSALAQDQDPVAAIAYDAAGGAYRLAVGGIAVTGVEPAIAVPGGSVTVRGTGFDPDPNRSRYWFGMYPSATWSVVADRSRVTVDVPSQAYSAPLTLERPGGVVVTLDPFLEIKGTVGTLAGNGGHAFREGVGRAGGLEYPLGLVVDPRGTLYVVDVQLSPRVYRVRRILADGTVSAFAGADVRCGDAERQADPDGCSADGIGSAARFIQIENVAIDAGGKYVYVSDEAAGRIRKIDTATAEVTTLRGRDGKPLVFSLTTGVSVDAAGNVYVVEYSNRRIQKVTPQGDASTVATLPTTSFGLRIFPDGSGGYVSLYAQHKIGRLTAAGGTFDVSVLAGSGSAGSADGTGAAASFFYPAMLDPGPGGTVIVADYMNGRIRSITDSGVVSTLAGGAKDFRDGPIGSALFGDVGGVAVGSGSIYVADNGNARIRVITP